MFRIFIIISVIVLSINISSQWNNNPSSNNPVASATGYQNYPSISSDGSDGTLIAWQDNRSGNYDIYVQRISLGGVVQWQANGIQVCSESHDQNSPKIIFDGSGGAIITWIDARNGNIDIYAQRINAAGTAIWQANGIKICDAAGTQQSPEITTDRFGGAIICWLDYRTGLNNDLYAQRVNNSGTVLWPVNGKKISESAYGQFMPKITDDGAGGAYIVWCDDVGYPGVNYDIYGQHIKDNDSLYWGSAGIAICSWTYDQKSPELIKDGQGGIILCWQDYRTGSTSNPDIYAQKLGPTGNTIWISGGVVICNAAQDQQWAKPVTDGSGGAIITWQDNRSGGKDIYAQKINSAGAVQWSANGISVSSATSNQNMPVIVSDAAGGAIIAWWDQRNPTYDIYAQRINSNGIAVWTVDGEPVCNSAGNQNGQVMIPNGYNGAVIAWNDGRNGNDDVFASKILSSGSLTGNNQLLNFSNSNLDKPIGDMQSAIDTINVNMGMDITDMFTVIDINITIDTVLHTNDSDLEFYLVHLNNTDTLIFSAGGSGDNFIGTQLNDSAAVLISNGTAPFTGTFRPVKPLSALNGLNPNGSWILKIYDKASGNTGTLKAWSMQMYLSYIIGIKQTGTELPSQFELFQNYPNPFNPTTHIKFAIAEPGFAKLVIYDIPGREVTVLVNEQLQSGTYQVEWDASKYSSGVYFYTLSAENYIEAKKMVLIK